MKKKLFTLSTFSLLLLSGCGNTTDENNKDSTDITPTTMTTPTLTAKQEKIVKEYATEEKDPLVELLQADKKTEKKAYLLNKSEFLKQWKEKKGVLIDLRTPAEIEKTPMIDKSAKNFDVYSIDFAENFRNLDKNQYYFIYCAHGNRSASVYKSMKKAGFTNVFELKGGILGK